MNLNAEDCLAFEDSRNGILSTQNADLNTIITVNGYTQDDDFSGAAIVLDNMGEPDQAFTVLAGNAHGHQLLDCELLEKIHAA